MLTHIHRDHGMFYWFYLLRCIEKWAIPGLQGFFNPTLPFSGHRAERYSIVVDVYSLFIQGLHNSEQRHAQTLLHAAARWGILISGRISKPLKAAGESDFAAHASSCGGPLRCRPVVLGVPDRSAIVGFPSESSINTEFLSCLPTGSLARTRETRVAESA